MSNFLEKMISADEREDLLKLLEHRQGMLIVAKFLANELNFCAANLNCSTQNTMEKIERVRGMRDGIIRTQTFLFKEAPAWYKRNNEKAAEKPEPSER